VQCDEHAELDDPEQPDRHEIARGDANARGERERRHEAQQPDCVAQKREGRRRRLADHETRRDDRRADLDSGRRGGDRGEEAAHAERARA